MNKCVLKLMLKQAVYIIGILTLTILFFRYPFYWYLTFIGNKCCLYPGFNGPEIQWFEAFGMGIVLPFLACLSVVAIYAIILTWYESCEEKCIAKRNHNSQVIKKTGRKESW